MTFDPASDLRPRWSPDGFGKSLVVASRRGGGERRLWRVPLDGGSAEPLTEGRGLLSILAEDGSRMFFIGIGRENIWSLSLDGGNEDPVTDFSGRRGVLGVLGLATDGSYL